MYYILDEDLNKYEIFDLSELLCYCNGVTHFYYPITFKSNSEITLNNNFLIHKLNVISFIFSLSLSF